MADEYDQWVIGGYIPTAIKSVEKNFQDGRFTFKCVADITHLDGEDPQTEIDKFNAISSPRINNEKLHNGGTKLQALGNYIEITDGIVTWEKCALHPIQYEPDSFANEIIEFDLIVEVELEGTGGGFVYTPDYNSYNNLDYYFWTDKTERITGDNADGTELGYMEIVEAEPVKRVEIYGSACAGSEALPAWIEVNGVRQYWHYSHDYGWVDNELPPGWEKLVFDLETPSTNIVIETSPHVMPNETLAQNRGAWLKWVRTIFE